MMNLRVKIIDSINKISTGISFPEKLRKFNTTADRYVRNLKMDYDIFFQVAFYSNFTLRTFMMSSREVPLREEMPSIAPFNLRT